MSEIFTCPYCFKNLRDDQVHFRSERYYTGMGNVIPQGYDDKWDVARNYTGSDREEVLARIRDREFLLLSKKDPVYSDFWDKFGGTTESDHEGEKRGVRAWERPIINPDYASTYEPELAKRHLDTLLEMQPDGSFFIRDEDGMVRAVRLKTGEECYRRVCCYCHNPLPENYGKHSVRFVTVIGITGSGKTVYLSQLLSHMKEICTKVGLSATALGDNVDDFIQNNYIGDNRPLPASTPDGRFQQPLFFDLTQSNEYGPTVIDTLVLYDIAGEVLTNPHKVTATAPFVQHADAFLLLVDPMQFRVVNQGERNARKLDDPTKVLDTVHTLVDGPGGAKCAKPFAVCISKIDMQAMRGAFDSSLEAEVSQDVQTLVGDDGLGEPIFNASQHNSLARDLYQWLQQTAPQLVRQLINGYGQFSFFALSALGCEVSERIEDGIPHQYAEGHVMPKRIEEPLYWIFNRMGFIGENERPFQAGAVIRVCPRCKSDNVYAIDPSEQTGRRGKWRKRKSPAATWRCIDCEYEW